MKKDKQYNDYWKEKKGREAIEGLIREGLMGNTYSDRSYNLDNQIKIGENEVYFFGEISRQANGRAPKIVVGFALKMQPAMRNSEYKAITKGLENWKLQKQKKIGGKLKDILDDEFDITIPINLYSTILYPLVEFKGTDPIELMQKAKKTAGTLQEKGIKLAEWYFKR